MNAVLTQPTPLLVPPNASASGMAVAAQPGMPAPFAALLAVSQTALSRLDATADGAAGAAAMVQAQPPSLVNGSLGRALAVAPNATIRVLASGSPPAGEPVAPASPRLSALRGKAEPSPNNKDSEESGASALSPPLAQPALLLQAAPIALPPGSPAMVVQDAARAGRAVAFPAAPGMTSDTRGEGAVSLATSTAPVPVDGLPVPSQREAAAGNRPQSPFVPGPGGTAASSAITTGTATPGATPPPDTARTRPASVIPGMTEASLAGTTVPSLAGFTPVAEPATATSMGSNPVSAAISAPPAPDASAATIAGPRAQAPAGSAPAPRPGAPRPGAERLQPQPSGMPATAEARGNESAAAPPAAMWSASAPEPVSQRMRQEWNPDPRDRLGALAQRAAPGSESGAQAAMPPEQASIQPPKPHDDQVSDRTDPSGRDAKSSLEAAGPAAPSPADLAPVAAGPTDISSATAVQGGAGAPVAAAPASRLPSPTPSAPPDLQPSEQIHAALGGAGQAGNASRSLTLHLRPTELGAVQIRIDRAHDAPARVDIAVHEPRTLALLVRDEARLSHTLDQAGVPREGRVLTIHLAAPDAHAPDASTQTPSPSSQAPANSFASGAGSGNPGSGGGSARQGADTRLADQDEFSSTQSDIRAPWRRAGLDITA
jgi:flagellar hook-length control protein FliK